MDTIASMPSRFEDQPWYPEWKKTTDRVIAALMARDSESQAPRNEELPTVNMKRPLQHSGCWRNSTDEKPHTCTRAAKCKA